VEGQLVRPVSEDGRPECLQSCHVLRDKIAVITEKRCQTDREHCADKEEEQDVKSGRNGGYISNGSLISVITHLSAPFDAGPLVQNSRKYLREDRAT
jgi:hypothetical protein